MDKYFKKPFLAFAACMSLVGYVQATPVTLTGDYIKTAVNDYGTLGSNGTASPGLLYDPTGTQTFGVNDYLTPGTPWDMFSLKSDQFGLISNNNDYGHGIATISGPTNLSSGSVNSASWSGELSGYFSITNTYTFSTDGERIDVSTVITALTDMTNLKFARGIDPDPDVNTYGTYDTINGRGDAGKGLAAEDWVHSVGANTGLPLGLYTDSEVTHNSGVSAPWSIDPDEYLSGVDDGDGDFAIGLGFDIGGLLAGESITLDYSYVMGGSLDDADIPSAVPVPAAVWLFGSGLLGIIGFSRKKKTLSAA